MKNLKIFAVVLFVMGMIAASCEGPEGPRGPAGAAGTNGTDGNANVIVYSFPADTFTTTVNSHAYDIPISQATFDSSFFAGYFHSYGGWYEVGQMGPMGSYQSRYWLYDYAATTEYGVRIHNVDGTTYSGSDVIWDSVKIFVIPANQFYAAEPDVDFSNYYEVESYFDQK